MADLSLFHVATAVAVVLVGTSLWPLLSFVLRLVRAVVFSRTSPIPGPPELHWLKGHADAILSDRVFMHMGEWVNKYGKIFKIRLFHTPAVVVTDPAVIHQVLRKSSPAYLPKQREAYVALELGVKPRVANILSSSDDAYWKAVRQGVAPCFSISNLKLIFPRVLSLSQSAVAVVGGVAGAGREVDVADLAKRISSDVMGSMLLDQDFGGITMKEDPYMPVFNDMLEAAHSYFSNPLRGLMVWDPEVRAGIKALDRHDKALEVKLAGVMAVAPAEHTVAGRLFKVVDPATGQPLAKPRLKAELAMILGAGFETTSHAITWSLAALATHPSCQERLMQELTAAGLAGPGARQYDWGDVSRLPYLAAVIKEGLRLMAPTSLGSARQTTQAVKVGGYDVPKGAWVMISQAPIGLSTHNYGPTAAIFDPERWMGTTNTSSSSLEGPDEAAAAAGGPPDPFTFSLGPRDCVGQTLARLELQVVLVTLVAGFSWVPGSALQQTVEAARTRIQASGCSRQQLEQQAAAAALMDSAMFHITLQPRGGHMWLKATPRV